MADDFRLPTDHGFVVVRTEEDGTRKVMVCDSVVGGEPQNVYAMHFQCTSLKVGPGVRLVNGDATSYSKHVVEVFAEAPGVVHVRALRRGMSPTLEAEARAR